MLVINTLQKNKEWKGVRKCVCVCVLVDVLERVVSKVIPEKVTSG